MKRMLVVIGLLVSACTPNVGLVPDAAAADASVIDSASIDAGAREWSFEVIETRTVPILETTRDVDLVRAHRPDGASSYLLYLRSPSPDAGVVVMTQPYAGIDWTGEDVDARWAAMGAGLHPDVEAPAYDGDDLIAYEPQTVEQAVQSSIVWAANGLAVVHAYGRFYAGGSLEDDALDSAAAFHFIRTRDELDAARIGVWGASWGGFMGFFGAARAPSDAQPSAVAMTWGPSDFTDLWAYTDAIASEYPTPSDAEAFFSTYRRRIVGTTGGPPPSDAFAPFDREALCAGLGPNVLSLHDDWDTLIPVEQTRELVAACPRIEPLYWHRQTPIDYALVGLDHGRSGHDEPDVPTSYTFAFAYVLSHLVPSGDLRLLASEPALASFLALVRAETMSGDATDALPRLRELADARVLAYLPSGAVEPAGDVLARAFTTTYGRAFTAETLRAELASGLPVP